MTTGLPFALAAALTLSTPALADPTVGLGLTVVFGGGQTETGVGLRVFSDDEEDSFVGTVGVDYVFGSQRIRPTLGGAYLGSNVYVGADLGFNLNGGGIDYGLGLGAVNTAGPSTGGPVETPDPVGTLK